jgi:hypothetical protein
MVSSPYTHLAKKGRRSRPLDASIARSRITDAEKGDLGYRGSQAAQCATGSLTPMPVSDRKRCEA